MESKIRQYILDLIQDELKNVWEYACELFGDNTLPSGQEINLAIPELAEISQAKRQLVQNIILMKTNYKIAATKDSFTANTMILIDKPSAK